MKKGEDSGIIENVRQNGVRVICFGGSNTFAYGLKTNYGTVLRDLLAKRSSVPVFVSMSGETAGIAMEAHEQFVNNVISLDPSVVVFEFGQHERDFHVPPDKLYNTLKDMIAEMRNENCSIVLLAPTLVNDKRHRDASKPYATSLQALAKETGSVFLDPAVSLKSIPSTYFRSRKDSDHWSEKGHSAIGKLLADAIVKAGLLPMKKKNK